MGVLTSDAFACESALNLQVRDIVMGLGSRLWLGLRVKGQGLRVCFVLGL